MREQIIRHGYTRPSEWDALEQRSIKTGLKVALRCPICDREIHHTDTTQLRCLACHAPVEIYQHRHHTETADTRVVYIQVKGQHRAVLTIDMQCLSCGRTLQADETCPNTCEIQTYLVLDFQDGELYIKRWLNLLNVPRDTPFIPIRQTLPTDATQTDTDTDTRANETQNTENIPAHRPVNPQPNLPQSQPYPRDDFIDEHPNRHTDVKGKVQAYLTEHHIATTQKLLDVCNCSRQALNQAIKKLIDARQIRKVHRGVYQLINHT